MKPQLAAVREPEIDPPRIVRFGLFEADLRSGDLLKQGRRLKLQTQPFQILAILLEHPGEIVTREELCRKLWPEDTFVDFDHSLNTAVRRLREALADSPENPIFVETVQRRGYRFIAPVVYVDRPGTEDARAQAEKPANAIFEVVAIEKAPEPAVTGAASAESRQAPARMLRNSVLAGCAGLLVGALMALAAAYFVYRPNQSTAHVKADQVRSLAVLPLENLSITPDQEFLADGMTDELIASLAKVKHLRVVPRTSSMAYKSTHKSLSEIAKELNVDAVVEGTVMRSGSRIRITTELVQIASDRALWAETYESNVDDVLSLQQRVAGAIVSNIQVELTPQERQNLKAYQPSSAEAYEDYLKGRYYWNKRSEEGLTKAIDYFERATKEDPNYALAYAGLADCYGIIGAAIVGTVPASEVAPKAEAAAKRALELDPTLAEAQTSLATVMLNYKWDWQGAESGFKQAIQLDPTYATAHQRYSLYLMAMGRTNESIHEIQEALKLDPLSVSMNFSQGWRLYMARDFDGAMKQLKSAIDMDPSFALAHMILGQDYAQKGQYALATTELETAVRLSSNSAPAVAALARVDALAGRQASARTRLEQLKAQSAKQYVSPFYLAEVYSALGDTNRAMDELDKAYQDRSNSIIFLRVDPKLDVLRSNSRFQSLLQKLQL
jgi:TolB-like protein/DNA-binding winged helix-turn-helix (wHTH) protein/Tfp pilus assembly protein PilF